jgi:hypothetical protein
MKTVNSLGNNWQSLELLQEIYKVMKRRKLERSTVIEYANGQPKKMGIPKSTWLKEIMRWWDGGI